jgi:hypothetical protein
MFNSQNNNQLKAIMKILEGHKPILLKAIIKILEGHKPILLEMKFKYHFSDIEILFLE